MVFSQAVNVSAHDRTTLDVREPLIAIGTYAVTVGNHNYPYIGGYSFNVVLNTDQADLTIDQKSQQNTANTEAVIGAVTGVIGTVIGTFSLVTSLRPKRDKDQKKTVSGSRAKAFCSNCGARLLDPKSQFCSRCGAPVETMMNRS